MHFLFISGAEIFVIFVIVLMLFGADKIPFAKGLGKGMRQLKDATNDIKREIQDTAEKQGIDTEFTDDIKKEVTKIKNKVQDNIDDFTGPIKRNL